VVNTGIAAIAAHGVSRKDAADAHDTHHQTLQHGYGDNHQFQDTQ